jgi:hypothetical protein
LSDLQAGQSHKTALNDTETKLGALQGTLGAYCADVVLSRYFVCDIPPLDHPFDTYSVRCRWT